MDTQSKEKIEKIINQTSDKAIELKYNIFFEGLGLEAIIEERKQFYYNKRADDIYYVRRIFLQEIRYFNLVVKGYQILKFRNIVSGFIKNILGGVYDKNFEILKDEESKKIELKVKFNGKSVKINKIRAMDLEFVLTKLINQFEIDMIRIKEI